MSHEEVMKGFDGKIMRRLWAYARKYRLLIAVALGALALGTAADLLLPVILQKTVDEVLIPQFTKIDPVLEPGESRVLTESDGRYPSVGATFLSAQALAQIPGATIEKLKQRGAIDSQPWLRLRLADLRTVNGLALMARERTFRSAGLVFVSQPVFQALSEAQRNELRKTDLSNLWWSVGLFLGLLVLSVGLAFGQSLATALVGQRVMQELRLALFDKTIRQRQGFLQTNPVGRLVTRLTNDVETINELFTSVLSGFIKDFAIMIGVVVVMFSLDRRLALITLATLVPVIILILIFRSQAREAYRRVRLAVSAMNTFLSEHFSGMSLIQLFVRQRRVHDLFLDRNATLMRSSLGEMRVFAIFRPLTDLLASISLAVIIYFGAQQFLAELVSLGILIAFINLIHRFFEPVLDISDKFNLLQSAMAGGERAFALLDEEEHIEERGWLEPPIKGALRFANVRFGYKKEEIILQDLSFAVDEGEMLAIVGSTGAGKTTITNLLTRLWDIDSGQILIDEVPLDQIALAHLRTNIQPLQQDVFLFTDTIRANILMGKELSDDRLWEILDQVQAKDFVAQLPQGLDSLVAEGATNLSGGQRQLLSFARILAQDPRVIIMDEASANIDSETERVIQAALQTILNGRTSLVIAHRLSTIEKADRILVLDKGRVVETGNHAELMAAKGFYWNLYRLQFEAQV